MNLKQLPAVIFLFVTKIFVEGSGESCSVFCVQATAGSTCDNVTGDCILGCQSGYAGSKCNIQCCANCQDCSLSQGSITAIVCNKCVKDFYKSGADCQPCSEMCARNESSSLSVCRQSDGRCEFGCRPGFYGDTCINKCPSTCNAGMCDESDGSCSNGCTLPVVTGPKCMESCNSGCVNRECSQDGTCLQGCILHFWDYDCQNQCSATCFRPVDIDTTICNQTNGNCLYGCVNGTYWDNNCTMECSPTCANRKCNYFTGNCVDGCVDEYEGPKCSKRKKADDDTTTIVIYVGPVVGFIIFVGLVIVCVICCKRTTRGSVCCFV